MLERRRLGRTGLEVACLGFGGIPIQRIGAEEAVEVIAEALRLGIDFIDTAHGYGDSEAKIGRALKAHPADVVLASKTPKRDPEGVRADFEESLARLGVDYIDIYQFHCVNKLQDYEKLMAPGGGYEVMRELQSAGRVGFVGITSHHLDIFTRALAEDRFDTIQVLYNFLEPEAEREVIPAAVERDVGFIAMKPLAGGVIKDCDLAIRHALLQPTAVVIPGVASIEEVRLNVASAATPRRLTGADRARMEEIGEEVGQVYCKRCDYCLPCESSIPISFLLHMHTIYERIGDEQMKQKIFGDILDKARNCTECGLCEERCPFDLPVRDLVKQSREFLAGVLSRI